jgi:protein-tyrosine phosphatase
MASPGFPAVLFVCTGNICRSPTAEGVFRELAQRAGLVVRVDSAGTHDYHAGEAPDRRAVAHARQRGYDLTLLRARQVAAPDFEEFDLLVAMDRGHLRILERMAPPVHRGKLRLMLEFAGQPEGDVPDPYYGAGDGFERVLDLVEAASRGLVDHLRNRSAGIST